MAGPGTALLLIDLQRDVVRGLGGQPVAEAFELVVERSAGLLERARKKGCCGFCNRSGEVIAGKPRDDPTPE